MTTSRWETLQQELRLKPSRWLVTGAAGFIGSHLCEKLIGLGQKVIGLDNFATGKKENIEFLKSCAAKAGKDSFLFHEANICSLEGITPAFSGVDYVLHQAALGSVPRSVKDPISSNTVNVEGFINVFLAARDAQAKRVVYASSSSVYGDDASPRKKEDVLGRPLSPYAVTKITNERYAFAFGNVYGTQSVGLRYFNVFGPRQDPNGEYAAVIPRWVDALRNGAKCSIFGDGSTSRDFCYVTNVVQANILAATTSDPEIINSACNIAVGDTTSLKQLFEIIEAEVRRLRPDLQKNDAVFGPFRSGDIKHSLADISRAQAKLGYLPTHTVKEGLELTVQSFLQ